MGETFTRCFQSLENCQILQMMEALTGTSCNTMQKVVHLLKSTRPPILVKILRNTLVKNTMFIWHTISIQTKQNRFPKLMHDGYQLMLMLLHRIANIKTIWHPDNLGPRQFGTISLKT